MYQNIKNHFSNDDNIHYYRSIHDFKESDMIKYQELIVYDYILHALDLKSLFDLKNYCEDCGIEIFRFDDELGEKHPVDFNEIFEINNQNLIKDTVEIKMDNANSSQIEIIKTVYKNTPQKNIAVVSLSEKAGSTFISFNLVKELSYSNITASYIEIPFKDPYAFEHLGLSYRLEEYDKDVEEVLYIEDLLGGNTFNNLNKDLLQEKNITWLTMNPSTNSTTTEESCISELINQCRFSSVNIMDIGKVKDLNHLNMILYKVDHLILIIDPLPSEILKNEAMIKDLKKTLRKNNHMIMIVNKFHKEVKIKELKEYLDFTPIITVSHIDIGYIYKAIYNFKAPIEIKECCKGLSEDMRKIMKLILPKEIMTKENKRFGLLRKKRE